MSARGTDKLLTEMTVNGQIFYNMVISAANSLDNNKSSINNMNVFPVPDGDTGINMSLTMSTVKELKDYDGSISDCAYKVANVILRSARGNSGAILSLFFRGMAKSLHNLSEADSIDIARAFEYGTREAYKAVMNPTEGTMLTIMRICAEQAVIVTKTQYKGDIIGLFTYLMNVAETALAQTPELLPVLKQANVVDAGGYGFVIVLSGMLAALMNKQVMALNPTVSQVNKQADFSMFSGENVKFAYCTECIVEKEEKYLGEGTATELYGFITQIGDSAVFIDDENIIKIHIHTNNPGQVLEKALCFGSLASVKIENMRLQHTEKVINSKEYDKEIKPALPTKKYGFVAVCMGSGICDTFRDLGVDNIVYGGQTMNPSTQDILNAINMTGSENVYVLPNNKNIYLVAKQAADMAEGKNVTVMPTRNVPQGIAALLTFDYVISPEENTENMTKAIGNVKSISTTHAVRDSGIDGFEIADGQILGLVDEKIDCVADSRESCIEKLLPVMNDAEYISVFYGEDIQPEEAEKIHGIISSGIDSQAEIVIINGGQPVYDYIISVE